MFGCKLQILVSHAWTLSDGSCFNMCNKLNSVYWAFHIWVNYVTVRTLHFCITHFEGSIFDLIHSKSGEFVPYSKKWREVHTRFPSKIMPMCTMHITLSLQESCDIAKMTARCTDKSKQTATSPFKITWLSIDSIEPDVINVGVERTFSPRNFSMFPGSMWMTFGLRKAKMLG